MIYLRSLGLVLCVFILPTYSAQLIQLQSDELTLEELTELIEELKRRSLKYDRIQELLNGQDINEIISKSEQIKRLIRVISFKCYKSKSGYIKAKSKNINQSVNRIKYKTSRINYFIIVFIRTTKNSDLQYHRNSHSAQSTQKDQDEQWIIELQNKLISLEQQNKYLKEEIQSISNIKIQIESKLRNSILEQNQLLSEKEKLAKETFYLVSLSNNFKTQLQNKQSIRRFDLNTLINFSYDQKNF
ncbi:unnamed protein product [Paramecium sonneborni]|uniref:Uncharacterized protein n=1 Tax=Paramecium sonneborni TaxID=65129 RepID=A0A8S1RPL4_9CILI|nr:unnamed protein product [Paramecium sonneborni]